MHVIDIFFLLSSFAEQFPEDLRNHVDILKVNSFSVSHYSENETLRVPSSKESLELEIAADLASQLHWKTLKQRNLNITRLKGELLIEQGKIRVLSENKQGGSSQNRPFLHWGSPDPENLVAALCKMGINGHVEESMMDAESDKAASIHVKEPNKALIEIRATGTIISAADENLASHIFKAVESVLEGI